MACSAKGAILRTVRLFARKWLTDSSLTALGAEVHEPVKDVGGGIKVASVRDPFGNLFSIIENSHFKLADER
jgi:hypothetical protein